MGGSRRALGTGRVRAGGTIEDAGAGIARVRLMDVHGRSFEDTVENKVVPFSSRHPVAMPMRLELIDQTVVSWTRTNGASWTRSSG